jgi:hypothetical protein
MNKLIVIIAVMLVSVKAYSQNIPNVEKEKRPYFLVEGELKKFEKVKAQLDIKVKAMGYGGSESFLTAFEKKSLVRYKVGELPKVIIKITGDEDPEDYISIFRQTKKRKRDRRRFKQGSRSLGGKSRNVLDAEVSFELKKIGENIYEVEFDDDLIPDEYAIVPIKSTAANPLFAANSQTIYCFGVD